MRSAPLTHAARAAPGNPAAAASPAGSASRQRRRMLALQPIEQHVGDQIHARPALFEVVRDDRDAQPAHNNSSKKSRCARATTGQANLVRARDAARRQVAAQLHPPAAARCLRPRATSGSSTRSPASPMTCGISPLGLASTGTPHAIASISIRPNCSRHRGSSGSARTADPSRSDTPARRRVRRGQNPHAAGWAAAKPSDRRPSVRRRQTARATADGRVERAHQHVDSLLRHETAEESDHRHIVGPAQPRSTAARAAASGWKRTTSTPGVITRDGGLRKSASRRGSRAPFHQTQSSRRPGP